MVFVVETKRLSSDGMTLADDFGGMFTKTGDDFSFFSQIVIVLVY